MNAITKHLFSWGMALALTPFALGLDGWESDEKTALQKASEQKKDVLLVVHPADWTPGEPGNSYNLLIAPAWMEKLTPKFVFLEESTQKEANPIFFFIDGETGWPYYWVGSELLNNFDASMVEFQLAAEAKPKVLAAAKRTEQASGRERFKHLGELLDLYPVSGMSRHPLYEQWKREALDNDTDDTSGIRRHLAVAERNRELYAKFGALTSGGDVDPSFTADPGLPTTIKQYLLLIQNTQSLVSKGVSDEDVSRMVSAIRRIDPDTKLARDFDVVMGNQLRLIAAMEKVRNARNENLQKGIEMLDNMLSQRQWGFEASQLLHLCKAQTLILLGRMDEGIALAQTARDEALWAQNALQAETLLQKVRANKAMIENLIAKREAGDTEAGERLKSMLTITMQISLSYSLPSE